MAREYKLLEVENLNTSFKIDAGKVLSVNGVSFTLDKGKVLGIVGESGSGKSVTAYSIMRILDKNGQIDQGKIIYNGTDLVKLSEKEMRAIRGNRISIIFQDAMTSLNPTWSIGNQLREAILTHARNPIEEAIYDIKNAVKSDEQRIAAMKRGLANHPEREQLRIDLATVEEKLVKDKEELEIRHKQAIEDYKKLKSDSHKKYKEAAPSYNKNIGNAFAKHIKHYFNLNKKPSLDEASEQPRAKELFAEIELKQKEYNKQFKAVEALKAERNNERGAEEKIVYLETLNSEKKILGALSKELKAAKRSYNRFISSYRFKVKYAPRKERRNEFFNAIKDKNNFYWECISEYKETKYSANKKAVEMLKEVGITDPEKRMKQYPFNMSGGMLQRCMIAMALVEKPDILIADEPTTALDVTIQAQILDLLKKLQKEYGMAIIIITHDLGVVAQICDEVDIMYAGRIVERGTVDDIFYNPQHEYTKGLLNSMPKLDSDGKRLEPIQGNPVDLFCLPKGCAFSSRCKECMEICIDKYPEEVVYSENGHAASCWKMIKELYEQGKIDIVNGQPEGKPLIYNGAIIANQKKERRKGHEKVK